jgi:NAD(P)-dependent dehydrogenase (short-subunit alcohol dehydrogenase family)
MDLELASKTAIVTGGSRGIGRAVARQLAIEGCDVAIVARVPVALKEAAALLSDETGRQVIPIAADTAVDESVAAMVDEATARLGGVDILVNAAARSAGATGAARTVAPAKLREEIDVKALGYLRCAQRVVPQMVERGWGRIINVGGLAARQTGSVSAAMRNAAVTALTKNLADELGPYGINVTAVHPGVTRTERIADRIEARAAERGVGPSEIAGEMGEGYAIGRLVEPEELGYVVAFLASPRSVSITGDAIACGGGKTGSIHY